MFEWHQFCPQVCLSGFWCDFGIGINGFQAICWFSFDINDLFKIDKKMEIKKKKTKST